VYYFIKISLRSGAKVPRVRVLPCRTGPSHNRYVMRVPGSSAQLTSLFSVRPAAETVTQLAADDDR